MGTLGVGILDNDSACDCYELYKRDLKKGINPDAYFEKFLQEHEDYFIDGAHAGIYGLALAMWETGTFTPNIFSKIKELIENGVGIKSWLYGIEEDSEDKESMLIYSKYAKILLDKFLILLSKDPNNVIDYSKILNVKYEEEEMPSIINLFSDTSN